MIYEQSSGSNCRILSSYLLNNFCQSSTGVIRTLNYILYIYIDNYIYYYEFYLRTKVKRIHVNAVRLKQKKIDFLLS